MLTDADALAFPLSTAAEAHRASQKDQLYSQVLYERMQQAAGTVLGAEHVNSPELRAAAAVLYYGLTLGRSAPTLGEEYCDMTRVNAQNGSHVGMGRRWACCIIYSLLPYACSKIAASMAAALHRVDREDAPLLHTIVPRLQVLSGIIDKLRLIATCRSSQYLHIADAIVGLAQVRYHRSAGRCFAGSNESSSLRSSSCRCATPVTSSSSAVWPPLPHSWFRSSLFEQQLPCSSCAVKSRLNGD